MSVREKARGDRPVEGGNGIAGPQATVADNGYAKPGADLTPTPSPSSTIPEKSSTDSPSLTAADREHLADYKRKAKQVRARVRGVALRHHPGMMLWGLGGTGKSWTVLDELDELVAKGGISAYQHHNSRISAKGLADLLQNLPHAIHVVEDAETLLHDPNGPGLLRSALWSQDESVPMKRPIKWMVHKNPVQFVFDGGLIIISNTSWTNQSPEIDALKTRINPLRLEVTDQALLALMKQICSQGYHRPGIEQTLTPADCWEVGAFILEQLSELKRPLDLRLFRSGLRDRIQEEVGHMPEEVTWRDLVLDRIREEVTTTPRRRDVKNDEARIAADISRRGDLNYAEKFTLFNKTTAHKDTSDRSYTRALRRWRERVRE